MAKPDYVLMLDAHPEEDGRIQKHIRFLQENDYRVYHIHYIPYLSEPELYDGEYSLFGEKSYRVNLHWKIRDKYFRMLNYLSLFSQNLTKKTANAIHSLGVPPDKKGIIHVHDPILLPIAKKIQRQFLTQSKIVYDRHEVYEDMKRFAGIGGYRLFEQIAGSSASGIVVVSDGLRDKVSKQFPSARIVSVPNFPPLSLIQRGKVAEKIQNFSKYSDIYCIYIGSLNRNLDRDINLLLKIAEQVLWKIPNSRFFLGGPCYDRDLLTTIDGLQKAFPSRFTYLGIVPYLKVIEITQNVHIGFFLINPDTRYWVPCVPNKVFEYLSCGVIPVVRADCDYLDEIRSCGLFFVRNTDESVISHTLISLLQNSEEMKTKMRLCTEVGSRFTYEEKAKNYLVLYGLLQ